jgi:hypothetical protein
MMALEIYAGSDGEATKRLYAELEALGLVGVIAMNLFRACKASARAKVYRGGGYRGMAYDKKQWSIGQLVEALIRAEALPFNARELSAESFTDRRVACATHARAGSDAVTYEIEYVAKNVADLSNPIVKHREPMTRTGHNALRFIIEHARAEMAKHGAISYRLNRIGNNKTEGATA